MAEPETAEADSPDPGAEPETAEADSPDTGAEPETAEAGSLYVDAAVVREPDSVPPNAGVTVSLNEFRAGGSLSRTSILCGSYSELGSDRGWVRISAEAYDEGKVEGWLHQVYGTMLTSHCVAEGAPA